MKIPNRFLEVESELTLARWEGAPSHSHHHHIRHLLAGLERQREELGPIADELINLLYRLGVAGLSETRSPQVKR